MRGRCKPYNGHLIDDVVSNLRFGLDGADVTFKFVFAISVHGEIRLLPDPDSANVHFVYLGPNLQPREIEEGHKGWRGEACGNRLAFLR